MTYIDEIALAIFKVQFPNSEPDASSWPLYRTYAVLALAKAKATTAEDVHDAWSAWMAELNPDHQCLIPFEELPARIQALDEPWVAAIHQVAEEMSRD